MKNKKPLIIVAALMVLGAGGYFFYRWWSNRPKKEEEKTDSNSGSSTAGSTGSSTAGSTGGGGTTNTTQNAKNDASKILNTQDKINAFRSWFNYAYPAMAKQIKLDKTGKLNSTLLSAWNYVDSQAVVAGDYYTELISLTYPNVGSTHTIKSNVKSKQYSAQYPNAPTIQTKGLKEEENGNYVTVPSGYNTYVVLENKAFDVNKYPVAKSYIKNINTNKIYLVYSKDLN